MVFNNLCSSFWQTALLGMIVLADSYFLQHLACVSPYPLQISGKKLAVSLIGMPLNVTWYFSLANFKILFFVPCVLRIFFCFVFVDHLSVWVLSGYWIWVSMFSPLSGSLFCFCFLVSHWVVFLCPFLLFSSMLGKPVTQTSTSWWCSELPYCFTLTLSCLHVIF